MFESSNCSIFLSVLGIVNCFNLSHCNGCVVASNCSFNLHFSVTSNVEHIFIYLFVIYISDFMQYLFKYLPPPLLLGCLLIEMLQELFIILDTSPLSEIYFACISLSQWFLNSVFQKSRTFWWNGSYQFSLPCVIFETSLYHIGEALLERFLLEAF